MTVVILEAQFRDFFGSRTGSMNRIMTAVGAGVEARARRNAQGPIIGIQSHDLLDGLRSDTQVENGVLCAVVGTNASHRDDVAKLGTTYPAWHDQNGRPWLSSVLEGFHL